MAAVAVAVAVGALSGALGTVAHLWTADLAAGRWRVGLALAVALVVAVDAALLSAVPRAAVALGDAAGRAVVVAAVLPRGPGGDIVLQGGWPSEIWILLSVLIPAMAGPPLATVAAVRRVRTART